MPVHNHDYESESQYTRDQTNPENRTAATTGQNDALMDTRTQERRVDSEEERPITVYPNTESFYQNLDTHSEFIGFGFDPYEPVGDPGSNS
jgi:hypothetical protein